MFSFLKNHPFAVEAFFESSLVLTFAVPREQLIHYVPSCLRLDELNNKWGFVAVAMVQTKSLRPKGFPRFMGNDFFLIGYRVFVRYTNNAGKKLRGLYILKSETDKKKMELLGNIFTHYQYTTTDLLQKVLTTEREISSQKSKFKVTIGKNEEDISLPPHSPFASWSEARKFAGPLPFTFSCNEKSKKILIIEGVRQNWIPKPVKVIDYNFEFINAFNFEHPVLANAFEVNNIPYNWKKGKIEICKQEEENSREF